MNKWMPSSGDVLLFAEQLSIAQRLACALTPYTPIVVTAWQALEAHLPRARCIVLADHAPDVSGIPARVRSLSQRAVRAAILAVTTPTPEHVRAFVGSGVSDILWLYDTPAKLQDAVGTAVRRQPLEALGAQLLSATHLPLDLRNTLAYLCRAPTGIRTVHELCEAAGCHRSTLWAQWRAIGGTALLRVQDLVDWVMLLRACSRHVPGASWNAVAVEMNVHEHTIARIARRLMRCSLRDLRHPFAVTAVHDALLTALEPIFACRPLRCETQRS